MRLAKNYVRLSVFTGIEEGKVAVFSQKDVLYFTIIESVKKQLLMNNLLKDDKAVVASGGADSLSLLILLNHKIGTGLFV